MEADKSQDLQLDIQESWQYSSSPVWRLRTEEQMVQFQL